MRFPGLGWGIALKGEREEDTYEPCCHKESQEIDPVATPFAEAEDTMVRDENRRFDESIEDAVYEFRPVVGLRGVRSES